MTTMNTTDITRKLTTILIEHLGCNPEEVTPDAGLDSLGADSLDTVDDKCSFCCHERNTTHKYCIFFDFTCFFVEHLEFYTEVRLVVEIFSTTFFWTVARLFEFHAFEVNFDTLF